jgi:hypothetical protein
MTELTVRPADIDPAEIHLAGRHATYWVTFGLIVFVILGINLFTDPTNYADFDTYVYYLDALVHFPEKSWMYFEVFSNIFLLSMHWITQSVLSGIILAHYALGAIFIFALARTFPAHRSTWPALLLVFAILGPLLAFVTMRATPAYFLVTAAVHDAIERRPRAWLFMLVAWLFHFSALLALPFMALLYFERHLPRVLRSDMPRKFYLFLMVSILALGVLLPELPGSLTSLIKSTPLISKYFAYTDIGDTEVRIGHYVFMGFVFFLTAAFLTVQDSHSKRLNLYVVTSLMLYVVTFFSASPVAASRQAPFWIMPMIAVLPWQRLGVRAGTAPLFILVCVGVFYFQFQQAYMQLG